MQNLMLRLAVLAASYFGWWEYFRRRWKIHVYFLPAFTLAVHFTLLFLPGILNFLEEASLALYFGGVLLCLDALRREKWNILKPYLNFGYILFAGALALTALGARGRMFCWFDCYTHWAVVVKNMLISDAFPNFLNTAVGFPSYPLGSSTLVYYFCNVTSDSEPTQMLAQGLLTLSMLLPAFAFGKRARWFCGILAAVVGNFLLGYNTPINELMVDTLLPLTAVAAILFAWRHCFEEKENRVYLVFPLLFLTMNIKNASIFFLATALLLLLFWQKQRGRSWKPVAWLALALAVGWFLWDRHCDYVFANADMTQHAISADYIKGRLSEKTPEVMWTIVQGVFRFAFTRREMPWLLAAAAGMGVLTWVTAPELKKTYGKLLAFLISLFVLYVASLAGMYVFSMSAQGALALESIERYVRTIDIVIFYLMLIYSFALLDQAQVRWKAVLAAAVLLFGSVQIWQNFGSYRFWKSGYNPPERVQMEALIAEYGIAPGHGYLVLCEKEDPLFAQYAYCYSLNSPNVTQLAVTEEAQLDAQSGYQYILVLDTENPVIRQWLQAHFPEQADRQVILCF